MTAILITGASSGLGEALACLYAGPGVSLFLGGRNDGRLTAVAALCRAKGAQVECRVVDVRDRPAMERWVSDSDLAVPLDLVVANAGISGGDTAEQVRAIFAVNLDGVVNTVLPIIAPMRERRRGQIALMASLAGYRGMPTAAAYAASKAAVKVWGEGLRGRLARDGIGVTVICPGFVESRMTAANTFPMPLLMGAEAAATRIKAGIDANRARIAFPWPLALAMGVIAAVPAAWIDPVLRWLPDKD